MRTHNRIFTLTAAAAVTGMVLAPVTPSPALAQPAPPPAAADQPTEDPPVRVGRLANMTGTVSFHTAADTQWSAAGVNYPVATGDSFWTEPNAGASLEVSASRIALAGGSEFDVTALDGSGLQAALPQGAAYLRLRSLAPDEAWSLQTPRGQVTFQGAGRYEVIAGDAQAPTMVTVLEGNAQISGPNLALQVGANQTATITGSDVLQASIGPVQQDAFLTAMLALERAPAQAAPLPPVVAAMPGGEDLATYGTWSTTPDSGAVWYPQVAADWAPYRDGRWAYIQPWGWTWVDDNAWGFAPSHYGRWARYGDRWGWSPGREAVAGPPVYAPALVTFLGVGVGIGLATGSVGWIPLGPGEAYHPWYHASDRYVQGVNPGRPRDVGAVTGYANRGATTLVPAGVMAGSRPVRPAAQTVSPQTLAAARPVSGREPIRPTALTAGVSPAAAHQMNLPPAVGGAAAHAAPGPAIRPEAPGVRPALRTSGQAPAPGPAFVPHGTGPGQAAVPGPGRPGAPTPATPGARPAGEPRPAAVEPAPAGAPQVHVPAQRPPGPVQLPAAVHAPSAPAPRPAEPPRAAPPPAVIHAAPPPAPRPAEPPRAAPPPAVTHAAPPPPAPRPAEPPHAAPPPAPHAAPAPAPHPAAEHEKKPGER